MNRKTINPFVPNVSRGQRKGALRGNGLMKMVNRSGPSIDAWETLFNISIQLLTSNPNLAFFSQFSSNNKQISAN